MLSTYIHTQAPAQATIVTIHNLMYSQLKEVAIRNLRRMKIAARKEEKDDGDGDRHPHLLNSVCVCVCVCVCVL